MSTTGRRLGPPRIPLGGGERGEGVGSVATSPTLSSSAVVAARLTTVKAPAMTSRIRYPSLLSVDYLLKTRAATDASTTSGALAGVGEGERPGAAGQQGSAMAGSLQTIDGKTAAHALTTRRRALSHSGAVHKSFTETAAQQSAAAAAAAATAAAAASHTATTTTTSATTTRRVNDAVAAATLRLETMPRHVGANTTSMASTTAGVEPRRGGWNPARLRSRINITISNTHLDRGIPAAACSDDADALAREYHLRHQVGVRIKPET